MRRYYRWLILGVLAFTVGTLFRMADLSGVALFRMFGFLGVAMAGAYLTWTATTLQMQSGRAELASSITSLPGAKVYQVPAPLPLPRLLQAEALVERNGIYYVVASAKIPDFRGRRTRRRLHSAVKGLARFGASDDDFQLRRVLVLLRRRVREEEREFAARHGVYLVNPETLAEVVV